MIQTDDKGHLLIVDDFDLNRQLITRRLESRGYMVHSIGDGQSALDLVEESNYDLVLLDITMPGMDGFEVLELLRQKYNSTDIAIIMVTARDQSEDVVKALGAGADDYITKPIDFPVAEARIQNQLKRRRTEIRLRESEQRYSLAAAGSDDGLWDWDLRTHEVYFSPRWKTMLGYVPEEIRGHIEEWFKRVHPDDIPRLKQSIDLHLEGKTRGFRCEYRMALKEGGYRWMLSRGRAVLQGRNHANRMVGWQSDTTNTVQHDHLTNLPNRALLLDRIKHAVARGKREKQQGFAVLYLGLDRFKIINQSLGHEIGDRLLVAIAKRLEDMLRPGDTISRLGGDEFAILIEEVTGVAEVNHFASAIQQAMTGPFHLDDDHEAHITLSMGIALGDKDANNPEEILRQAHTALNKAKTRGKDCFVFFSGDDAVSTLRMENHLRKALDRNELKLAYQPQIDTKTGEIVGVEALLRWTNEELGHVPPSNFIPLAEETGLIMPIGEWVLRTACKQHVAWLDAGLQPVRMAVNISSGQFRRKDLPSIVSRTLDETGMQAAFLDLELTETLLIQDMNRTIEALGRLNDLGVHLSIDDFGTGYSSLSYLKRFPIDTLKIDRTFVMDIGKSDDDAAIARAIIHMAHGLCLRVIAEGVETSAHRAFLEKEKCDEMQGYFFSKPADPDTIAALLGDKNRRSW